MSQQPVPIRVGIISAACLGNRLWEGIHRAGFCVTILGCRDIARGKTFVDEAVKTLGLKETPRVGSYDDVIHASDVDVIYIPTPTTTRDKWVRECAKAGKNVVGEKPPAKNAEQLREWLDLFEANNLLYMDGTMFSHGTRIVKFKESIAAFGGPKHIDARITLLGTEQFMASNCRVNPELEPYGALGDLGWYCIRYILHILDFLMPDSISAKIVKRANNGTILALEAQLCFTVKEEPVTASFYCSFIDLRIQRIRVFASNGVVTLQGAVNQAQDCRPHYFVRKAKWDGIKGIPENIEDDGEIVYLSDEEPDWHYQIDRLWSDAALALVKSSSGATPTADTTKAKMYAEYAYKAQKIMDDVAKAAFQAP